MSAGQAACRRLGAGSRGKRAPPIDADPLASGPEAWRELLERVDETTDRLGNPIDERIRDVVAGLWGHGVPTIASCEGHDDWGSRLPWVDIGEYSKVREIWVVDRERHRRNSLRGQMLASALLSNYYAYREPAWGSDLGLIPMGIWGYARLKAPVATEDEDTREPLRPEEVRRCRADMRSFGEFLRDRILKG